MLSSKSIISKSVNTILPFINKRLTESIGGTIKVLTNVQYCIHNNKFHNVKIFGFLGT